MVKTAELLEHDDGITDVYQVNVEDFEPSEEQISFDAFKGESQDDLIGILKVYRIPNADEITNLYTAKTRYLFNVPIDQFGYEGLLDFIREKYGSGAYRLIGTIPGKKGSRLNKIVEIEAPMKDTKTDKVSESGARPESTSQMLAAFANMIKESQERTAELVRGMLQNQVPKDPMEQMGVMMGVMSQMKDFFGGGGNAPTFLGELEKAKAINDLIGGGGETNESDIWVTLAKQFAPAIVKGITENPALPAPMFDPVTGAPVPITGPVVAPVSGAGVAEPNKESSELTMLKTQAAVLFSAAEKGVAPEKMADTILNVTPEARLNDLYAFMNSDSCIQTFLDAYPPLIPHKEWLSQVQVSILGELVRDDFREPEADETLHPGELTGEPVELTEKELTDEENKNKIEPSAETAPKKKAKSKRKKSASKKSASKSSEGND